jgi:lysophospholipase L1-like esterase
MLTSWMMDRMFAGRSLRSTTRVATAVLFALTLLASMSCTSENDPSSDVAPVSIPESMRPTAQPKAAAPSPIVVIGDSYTGGSNAGGFGDAGWPALVWKRLEEQGIAVDPQVAGIGGSGYVTRGPTGKVFGDESARLVSPVDKVVVFFGGMNDGLVPPAQVAAAAKADFEAVRQTAPNARLLVIGPAWPKADRPELLNLRDAIKGEALAVGADFVDPVADGWFTDTPPDFIGADKVHPTDAGHVYMADKIEPYIREELVKVGAG